MRNRRNGNDYLRSSQLPSPDIGGFKGLQLIALNQNMRINGCLADPAVFLCL